MSGPDALAGFVGDGTLRDKHDAIYDEWLARALGSVPPTEAVIADMKARGAVPVFREALAKAREALAAHPPATGAISSPAEPGLTGQEKFLQAGRCACRGADDWCPCQNVPDRLTIIARKEAARA